MSDQQTKAGDLAARLRALADELDSGGASLRRTSIVHESQFYIARHWEVARHESFALCKIEWQERAKRG